MLGQGQHRRHMGGSSASSGSTTRTSLIVRAFTISSAFLSFVIAAMTAAPAIGAPPEHPLSGQGLLCRTAISAIECSSSIPAHLLAAIGRVESGRRDPVTGAWHPWPWTVNADGNGLFYETKAQAIVAVQAFQERGVRSIDIGCMQVNLMHHPDAFQTLDQAFEPRTNVAYAARFLKELYAETGDWVAAGSLYHSATPELQSGYQRRMIAAWADEAHLSPPAPLLARMTEMSRTPGVSLVWLRRTIPVGRRQRERSLALLQQAWDAARLQLPSADYPALGASLTEVGLPPLGPTGTVSHGNGPSPGSGQRPTAGFTATCSFGR